VAIEEPPKPGLRAALHAVSSTHTLAFLSPERTPATHYERPSVKSAPSESPEGCRSG
jgi:hypothetical protein